MVVLYVNTIVLSAWLEQLILDHKHDPHDSIAQLIQSNHNTPYLLRAGWVCQYLAALTDPTEYKQF